MWKLNCLKEFLLLAAALRRGDEVEAERLLEHSQMCEAVEIAAQLRESRRVQGA